MKKEEVEQLKECLKDKDRRLRKLEDKIKLRNEILLSIGFTLLCFSWIFYFYLFKNSVDKEMFRTVFTFIGIVVSVGGTFFIWLYIMIERIWKGKI